MIGKLILYVGPMMAGKTERLLSDVAPLQYSPTIKFTVIQPEKNSRDGKALKSRSGSQLKDSASLKFVAKMPSFEELGDNQVVAIEEFHFFGDEMIEVVAKLLLHGVTVHAAGLDMDYRGNLTSRYKDLLELAPHKVILCRAVCTVCGAYAAQYTQIYRDEVPVLDGAPEIIPEDGTYRYAPVCRGCFRRV
ncbi:thymidine kinase [soil metagenome]